MLGIILLVIGTNVAQFFIQKNRAEKNATTLQYQIDTLQATLDGYGPDVTVYTVPEEVGPGIEVTSDNICTTTVPQSYVGDSFVLTYEDLIGKYFKVNTEPGTILTYDMVMEDWLDDTLRDVDVTVCHYPVGLHVGDYIDIRISMPYGQEYVVISHVRVQEINEMTIKLYLTEAQQFRYRSACVDYYLGAESGTLIYMTKYLEPGVQNPAEETYAVSDVVRQCMITDTNIVDKALAKIARANRPDIDTQKEIINEDEERDDKTKLNAGATNQSQSIATDAQTVRQVEQQEEEMEMSLEDEGEYYEELGDSEIPDEPVDASTSTDDVSPTGDEPGNSSTTIDEGTVVTE